MTQDTGQRDVVERLQKWGQLERASYGPTNNALAMEDGLAEILSLRSRVERLETALRIADAILSNCPEFSTTHGGRFPVTTVSQAREIVRAALSSTASSEAPG